MFCSAQLYCEEFDEREWESRGKEDSPQGVVEQEEEEEDVVVEEEEEEGYGVVEGDAESCNSSLLRYHVHCVIRLLYN